LGIEVRAVAGATVLIAAAAEALAMNRVIELGLHSRARESDVDEIIRLYTGAGVERFVIQLSPEAEPRELGAWCTARHAVIVGSWSKMARPLTRDDLADDAANAGVTVQEIGPTDAVTFECIVARELGAPEGLESGVRTTIGKAEWRYYLAYIDGAPIAGAASYCNGEYAWFGLGATAPEFRRRGAQSALLMRRIRDATAGGCRWATADTLTESPTKPNPSYRNMCRLGFTKVYDRPNYMFDLRRGE
jgi:GNAT superfamily N-acetyltransferase